MADVRLPIVLRAHAGGQSKVAVSGGTVGEILKDLVGQYPGIAGQILMADGALHKFVNIYVNDDDIRYIGKFEAPVKDTDTITIQQAVAGGAD